jgi:hypothetical protein
MDYPFLKHLSDEQIQILKTTCEGGTLETMNTVESGFASWGHANFLANEVVRLALELESRNKANSQLHTEVADLLGRLKAKEGEMLYLIARLPVSKS